MLLKYLKKVNKSRLSNWPLFPRAFPLYLGKPFPSFRGFCIICGFLPTLQPQSVTINSQRILFERKNAANGWRIRRKQAQHQRAHSDCLTLCLCPDRRHLPDDRTAPSGAHSPPAKRSSTFCRWGKRSPLPPALPSTSELSSITRSVTPGKAAPSSRRLTSSQCFISRQLTAGRMIHDTHTIDVFAHFCNTDVQL